MRLSAHLIAALLPFVLAPLPVRAQTGDATPRPIAQGEVAADSIAPSATHAYTIELGADEFVFGEVDQQSVDVAITVRDPDGEVVRRFDDRRRGVERIHFETRAAGAYRIEVAPEEDGTGRYAVRLDRVEPVAVDADERVDQLMAPYTGDVPGGVVGVVREGELVFARGYGMANLTHHVPFSTATRTNIGSMSKQFTAFAITLLRARGELSLDDDVREYIPELPEFEHPVTLRHLLTHTSGYREFLNTLALAGRRIDEGDYVDRDELIEIVQRQPELQNEPGAEWNYNNTAYGLLSVVVERVADTPFPEWMRENVFEPLGMRQTVVRASPSQIVENSAQGYIPEAEGGYREAADLGGAMGAGGIYTTVADLARWVANLETGELGGRAIIDTMTTPYILTTGDTTEYGFGLFIDELRGARRIQHGGADVAHRAMLAYYPGSRTGVITLSNNAAFSGAVATAVAEAYLGDALEPESEASADAAAGVGAAPFDPETYDPAAFDEIAGRYALDEAPAFILTFFREADTLYTQATGQQRVRMEPTSDSSFTLVGVVASVTFHRGEEGEITHAMLHQNGEHRATRLEGDRWKPSVAALEAFTGRFYSEELETFYTVALEDEELVVRHRRFDDVTLEPGEKDAFTGSFPIAEVEFVRDDDGRVIAFLVSNVRARDIRFDRVR